MYHVNVPYHLNDKMPLIEVRIRRGKSEWFLKWTDQRGEASLVVFQLILIKVVFGLMENIFRL